MGRALPELLGAAGLGYEHMAALGGLRSKAATPPEVNVSLDNYSFHI